MSKLDSCVLVIFGSTGDLAKRKLFPALYALFTEKLLPPDFYVVAMGRKEKDRAQLDEDLKQSISGYGRYPIDRKTWEQFVPRISYFRADINDSSGYGRLQGYLKELEQGQDLPPNHLFFLALAPENFGTVVEGLKSAGLLDRQKEVWNRVVFEKPFGDDLQSARKLNERLRRSLKEDQIYRIDHYLGKEMIQNIMVIRFANILFEPLWSNKYIDHVQISSTETVGVEDRASYYENAGALKDMVQNHMLQLLTLVAMEPPASLNPEDIRGEKAKVLSSLKPMTGEEVLNQVVRGQYGPGTINGQRIPGYREEDGVAERSDVETFVALRCFIENFRWAGVPFYLRTGKRLPEKSTEVIVQFKELPGVLYFKEYSRLLPNQLVFRIAPLEGIYLQFNAKKPGTKNFIVPVKMDFCQNCEVGFNSPEAYERLLLDAVRGDPTLFTRWDEVENAWKFVSQISRAWEESPHHPLFPNYTPGEWGPAEANLLLLKEGRQWIRV